MRDELASDGDAPSRRGASHGPPPEAPLESAPMASHPDEPTEVAESEHSPLDPETRARRDAALRLVRKHGDPVLRSRALRSTASTTRCARRCGAWGSSCTRRSASGSPRTQVGLMNRVLVYRVEAEAAIAALVNPVLEWAGEEREAMEEGCLSLPGVLVEVDRPVHVRVRAQDERGERDPDRGVRAGGSRDPARDGPSRRRADPGPHVPGAAQGSHAHAARDRSRAARRVRLTARCAPSTWAPRRSPPQCSSGWRASEHRPQLVDHPARPAEGPRPGAPAACRSPTRRARSASS